MLETIIIVLHLLVALAVIVLVLVQHGKGADMGASFGSGASTTVFGSQGSASFLSRTTAALVAIFFITSVGLTYYAKSRANPSLFSKTAPVATQPADTTQQPVVGDSKVEIPAVDHTPAPANENSDNNAVQTPASTTELNKTATPQVNHKPANTSAGEKDQSK